MQTVAQHLPLLLPISLVQPFWEAEVEPEIVAPGTDPTGAPTVPASASDPFSASAQMETQAPAQTPALVSAQTQAPVSSQAAAMSQTPAAGLAQAQASVPASAPESPISCPEAASAPAKLGLQASASNAATVEAAAAPAALCESPGLTVMQQQNLESASSTLQQEPIVEVRSVCVAGWVGEGLKFYKSE